MTELLLTVPFSATHQILINGELEPVHGHEFVARFTLAVEDQRDVSCLAPFVLAAVAPLRATSLGEVTRSSGGHPSAERIAAYLHARVQEALTGQAVRVVEAGVTESVGCEATYRE